MTKADTLYVYLPSPPLTTMDEGLLKKILKRNNIAQDMTEEILQEYKKECDINSKYVLGHSLNITIDYISPEKWSNEPVYVPLSNRFSDLMLTYTQEEYKQHISATKKYAKENDDIQLNIERINFFKDMNVIFIPNIYGASSTLRNNPIYLGSFEKPIVNSFAELMHIISPRNKKSVMKSERETFILNYFNSFISPPHPKKNN